ncbi:primosomal protein N' [Spongiactinospora sp. TRM90649]|uniref:primosomal protein N' n=1 Tax=Spongiactinospora sp. TRM90649 TaxID=3031114 RepID=UPI0023F6CA0F|nr:primosomal protein N' [Spongiactinospora sp. TRM90649]MDF5756816.1 primosomal protein N' [Spongiactinospora sp. TRM90649]
MTPGGGAGREPAKGAPEPAPQAPVARVIVDNPLPHLDREFDYLVPASLHDKAVPGCRVRVRFAGKLIDGFLLERTEHSGHTGRLTPLERVISPEPVLTSEIAALARAVADRYAGTRADVLRLAIPPRHARVEAEPHGVPPSEGDSPDASPHPGVTPPSGDSADAHGSAPSGDASDPVTSWTSPGSSSSEGSGEVSAADSPEWDAPVPPSGPPRPPSAGASSGLAMPSGSPGGAVRRGVVAAGASWHSGVTAAFEAPSSRGARGANPAPSSGGSAAAGSPSSEGVGDEVWGAYPAGRAFLGALVDGRAPRAVWSALPGEWEGRPYGVPEWAVAVAVAARAALTAGRGTLVVVPDGKDVALADEALSAVLGPGRHVALTADLGPAERYRRWLRVLRGEARVVAGTRAAVFAPVPDLGLAVVWDDGDDLLSEPLAPYCHAREVLALRAHQTGAALLIGGYARTAEATRLVGEGWARPIVASRATVRARAPRVRPAGEDAELARDEAARAARLPTIAWRALRAGLERGPVLVQVPRRGYLPVLACQGCRAAARCVQEPAGPGGPRCGGPLALRGGHAMPYCHWCGRIAGEWRCPTCGSGRVRAAVVGARRTAEELGRAFPQVTVRTSGRDGVLARVGPGRALVVATPGAEPVAAGGYAAGVLLDGWALLGRPDLRAAEETMRRWMNAAALLRPGGELVVLADTALPAVQALLRWDPVTHAERELSERIELAFPPAVRLASLTGVPAAVREMLGEVALPPGAQVLGPVPVEAPRRAAAGETARERALIRVHRGGGTALAVALKAAAGARSARKAADVVRVCVDPMEGI